MPAICKNTRPLIHP